MSPTPTPADLPRTEEEWQKRLSPEQFRVLRQHGTERPGSSPLDKNYAPGNYYCAGCGALLFTSDTKFNSGTGWPSFYAPVPGAVGRRDDFSYGMHRIEVYCTTCGGHLGHVFPDGPPPTGERYCINGVALTFVPAGEAPPQAKVD